jgi:hypothetical protein
MIPNCANDKNVTHKSFLRLTPPKRPRTPNTRAEFFFLFFFRQKGQGHSWQKTNLFTIKIYGVVSGHFNAKQTCRSNNTHIFVPHANILALSRRKITLLFTHCMTAACHPRTGIHDFASGDSREYHLLMYALTQGQGNNSPAGGIHRLYCTLLTHCTARRRVLWGLLPTAWSIRLPTRTCTDAQVVP